MARISRNRIDADYNMVALGIAAVDPASPRLTVSPLPTDIVELINKESLVK